MQHLVLAVAALAAVPALVAGADKSTSSASTATSSAAPSSSGGSTDTSDVDDASYFQRVCSPFKDNSTHAIDLAAPCNQASAILDQCLYGPLSASALESSDINPLVEHRKLLSNATQRACACESQLFSALQGCIACFTAHGGKAWLDATSGSGGGGGSNTSPSAISSLSASYCAASATPSAGAFDVVAPLIDANAADLNPLSSSSSFSSRISDPIGTSTQVELYYTPSVTGSAAWHVQAHAVTVSGSAGRPETSFVFSASPNSAGQLVATAKSNAASVPTSTGASASGSGSGATTTAAASGSGSVSASASSSHSGAAAAAARQTEGAAALAGVFGFAALAVLF